MKLLLIFATLSTTSSLLAGGSWGRSSGKKGGTG
ncbi:hypothetical protein TrRE_jg875, partial [Triparma retinervis]